MSSTKLSIIIPTFEPKEYVLECLKSIDKQDYTADDLEVLLILNGQRDPYWDVLMGYINELEALPIRLFYCDELGVSNARNVGLNNKRGEYVIFVDDDDLVSPHYISCMMSVANSKDLVVGKVMVIEEGVKDPYKNSMTKNFEHCLTKERNTALTMRRNMTLVTGKLYPVSLIENMRFNPRFQNGEDSLFIAQMSKNIRKIVLANCGATYFWRNRKESLSRGHMPFIYDFTNTTRLILELIKIYYSEPSAYKLSFIVVKLLGVIKGLLVRQVHLKIVRSFQWAINL